MSADERNIRIEDETLAAGYTVIPNWILRSGSLAPGAKLTYVMLLSYAWNKNYCFPGQQTLAKDIGVTDRAVRNYMAELVRCGLLRIEQRGQGQTAIYHLPRWQRPEDISGQSRNGTQGRAERGSRQERKQVPTEEHKVKNKREEGNGAPSVAPALSPSLDLNRVPLDQQKALRTSGTYGKMVQY